MKTIIEALHPMNRCLLGEGYDNALEYLKHLVDLEVIEIPSGTELGTWIVPQEWIIKDAWVKFDGKKIIDYKKDPLSVVIGSAPFNGKVKLDEFLSHLNYEHGQFTGKLPDATPYVTNYYGDDWGVCMPKNKVVIPNKSKKAIKGVLNGKKKVIPMTLMGLKKGDYEVFIDTKKVPGKMKLGVHTIKGKSDREILLLAHLDHPYQSNDNLSGVACLIDVAKRIKCEHTIKIIFCPETIGSTAYALTQDTSKVDFAIAVDICGNDSDILVNKAFDREARINKVVHLAIHSAGETYRKGEFRSTIGSDESVFNDPEIGIPSIMISRHPFQEYHTSADTPDRINYDNIKKTATAIMKIIEIYESDYIPKRKFKGQLMRSRYGIQTENKQFNLAWDYMMYATDGKKYLSELCCDYGLLYDQTFESFNKLEDDGKISRVSDSGKVGKQEASE